MTHLTEELAYWIKERESIRLRRLSGLPAPWSADPIFQTVRFCNVHREDDPVTQWFRNYWNKPDDPIWKFVLGRMINLPESLNYVREQDGVTTLADIKFFLKQWRDRGNKTFTSAYTISTCGKKMDKLDYVFDVVTEIARAEGDQRHYPAISSLAKMANWLECFNGLGTFLSGQVIADMKNTVGHPLHQAPDWWTWSAPGPGSLRGLSWYFYGEPTGVTPATYQDHIILQQNEVYPLVYQTIGMTHMQDWQNVNCEFGKFMKVKRDPKAHVRNRVHYA